MQGFCAALTSYKLAQPKWWLPIHFFFLPAAIALLQVGIAPYWYLAGFLLLLAIFWRTDLSRVPLYLSNAATAGALAQLLPATPSRLLDLGCGEGGLLMRLALLRPDCHFVGIEHAPLPFAIARLRHWQQKNTQVFYGDFWQSDLSEFDLVYAFLSPVPMRRLLAKARAEMRPGTWLVANSFAVPDATPNRIIAVGDRRGTELYCYCN